MGVFMHHRKLLLLLLFYNVVSRGMTALVVANGHVVIADGRSGGHVVEVLLLQYTTEVLLLWALADTHGVPTHV